MIFNNSYCNCTRLYLFGWLEGESLTRVIRYYAVPLAGGSLTVIVIFIAPQKKKRMIPIMKSRVYSDCYSLSFSMRIETLSYIVIQIIDYDVNNVDANKKYKVYTVFLFSLCRELYMFVSFVHNSYM